MGKQDSQNARINSKAKQDLLAFLSATQLLTQFDDEYLPLIKRVDGGEEVFAKLKCDLRTLAEDIVKSLPTDQYLSMLKQSKYTAIKVVSKNDVRDLGDDWLISKDDLVYLANLATQGKCLMCEDTSGYDCRLRKLMHELPLVQSRTTSITMACMKPTEEF